MMSSCIRLLKGMQIRYSPAPLRITAGTTIAATTSVINTKGATTLTHVGIVLDPVVLVRERYCYTRG